MENVDFSIKNKFKRFLWPLRKHWLSVPLCILTIWATMCFGSLVLESRKLQESSYGDLLVLGSAMLSESGFRFTNAVDQHLEMLDTCVEYMKYRSTSIYDKIFTTKYLPEKTLDDLRETLCANKTDEPMAAKNIWKTGEKIMLLRANLEKLPLIITDLRKKEVPDWFLEKIENSYKLSKEAVIRFQGNPTLDNLVLLCEANRVTTCYLYFARSIYHSQKELFKGFQKLIKDGAEIEENQIKTHLSDSEKRMRAIITHSENRRLGIIGAIMDGKMEEAHNSLWNAIDASYKERTELLELSAELHREKQGVVGP
jgi:hypothetical protein